jgi:CubicO group peptidase (beta-lactamase class C family)
VDQVVTSAMQRQHVPAMTVAAALSDRIVYSSAAAAMTLVDSGNLDVDAPVQRYYPSFPLIRWRNRKHAPLHVDVGWHCDFRQRPAPIRVRHRLFLQHNTVVGCVIEGASGQRFESYVAEHVLKPAGMTHSASHSR